ncbi:MAG: SDR family oxidoreductase [Desulfobaccales bacterium]
MTGASQGIGAGIVKGFVGRGFNVVANSRKVTQATEIASSDRVALVDGHSGEPATAAKIVETARSRFQSIDALVNNAGSFFPKPFTDYTAGDFKSLVATNREGFLYLTQLSIKQMLAQKTVGRESEAHPALAFFDIMPAGGQIHTPEDKVQRQGRRSGQITAASVLSGRLCGFCIHWEEKHF